MLSRVIVGRFSGSLKRQLNIFLASVDLQNLFLWAHLLCRARPHSAMLDPFWPLIAKIIIEDKTNPVMCRYSCFTAKALEAEILCC